MKRYLLSTVLGSAALTLALLLSAPNAIAALEEQSDDSQSNTSAETRIETDATVDTRDEDSDNDGVFDSTEDEPTMEQAPADGDDQVEGANYNNSRSNRSTVRANGDLDADGYVDIEVERMEDEDTDSDGEGGDDRANYNNSRSNRANIRGNGDVEIDDTVTGTETRGVIKELDKASPKLMDTLSIDKSSPLLYQGVSIRAAGDVCANGEDCNDDDRDISPGDIALRVSGVEVRGWNPDQKQELRERLAATEDDATTANTFGLRAADAAMSNEAVVDVATDAEATAITYNTRIRLFGFIPMNVRAVARAESNGAVSVDYPWYAFLARKGADRNVFSSLVVEIRSAHDAMISVGQ